MLTFLIVYMSCNKFLKLIKMLKRVAQSRMWYIISKEDEKWKTTIGFGRWQFGNDVYYKRDFCKYRETWVRFLKLKEVKFHVYILNINYTHFC